MNAQADEVNNSRVLSLAGELRAAIGKLSRRLREQGHFGDLTSSQTSVLGRLFRDGPATVSDLARAEGMRQQSMGAIVSALQEGGYVVGSPDPNDGRRTILSLTDMSREKINVSRALREDWLVRVLQENLSAAEQAELAGVVGHLQTLADAEFPVRVRF